MNNNILIIGGSSFLGVNLVEKIISSPNTIGITYFKGSLVNILNLELLYNKKIKTHYLDILNISQNDIDCIVSEYDIIINCIGQVSKPIGNCFNINSLGIIKIIESISKLNKKLIHISTVGVYGTVNEANESSKLMPESPYSISKAMAEILIINKLHEKQYCILRLSNLYGNKQEKGILSYLLKSALSDKVLNFDNNGELVRYFLDIEDCASIISLAIENKLSGIFNLRGDEMYNIKELVSLFELKFNIKYNAFFSNQLPIDNTQNISNDKIKSTISFHFKNNIKKLINYYIV